MFERFALRDRGGVEVAGTCLCKEHLTEENKAGVVEQEKGEWRSRVDGGYKMNPMNELVDDQDWREVSPEWSQMECVICGRNAAGKVRRPDTDYEPYGRG